MKSRWITTMRTAALSTCVDGLRWSCHNFPAPDGDPEGLAMFMEEFGVTELGLIALFGEL